MPVLLGFLVAALTMRLWSEERRAGTLETLLTVPVSHLALVFGKFLAALALVAVALALTLPLPHHRVPARAPGLGPGARGLSGDPAAGGGLSWPSGSSSPRGPTTPSWPSSARALVCGVFYLIGSPVVSGLFGNRGGELLQLLGSGARFESIARGVIDLRDLYFYVSVIGVFLALNVYSLERLRWAEKATGAAAGAIAAWAPWSGSWWPTCSPPTSGSTRPGARAWT